MRTRSLRRRRPPARVAPRPASCAGSARLLSTGLVALAALAFLLLAIGPHVFGYRTATMLTGSMAPGINPGDVVVSVPKPADQVAVGDIISYHIPVQDHRVETHRVIKVTHDANGRLAVVTKGDANNGADPWVATLDGDTVWQTKARRPARRLVDPRTARPPRAGRRVLGRPRRLRPDRPLADLGVRRETRPPSDDNESGDRRPRRRQPRTSLRPRRLADDRAAGAGDRRG